MQRDGAPRCNTLVDEQGLDFQVIAGVSAGALNALMLAQGAGRDGLRGRIEELKRLWLGIRSEHDIYRERFGGKVLALVHKDSVYDPEPLREKIRRHANLAALRQSGREFRIGVAWLESGLYECIDQHHADVAACTMASSSIPFVFPRVRIGERSGVDGGVRNATSPSLRRNTWTSGSAPSFPTVSSRTPSSSTR